MSEVAMTRLRRYVASACDGPFGSAIASEHYVDEGARVIRLGNIGSAEWLDGDVAYLELDYWRSLARHHAHSGDLVVAALGDENHPVGRATVVPDLGPAIVKADCHRLRLQPERADARFLAYYLSNGRGRYEAARVADGSTRKRLTLGKTLALPAPDLPATTQRAIADFLDSETARIDALISRRRRMIGLIEERSLSSQIEFVTGRWCDHPLRRSGLAWLGDIPTHWSLKRLKHLARLETGHTPSRTMPKLWENCTIPWVTLNDVGYLADNEFIEETVNLISEAGIGASSARVLPAGTVVLSRDATIGRVGIMPRPMATSQHFVDWVCGPQLRPRYLWLVFRTVMQAHFNSLTDGATLRTIGMPDVLEFVAPVPPVEEQDLIVKRAEADRERAKATKVALDKQIGLLQEHRQALITAAVTGQMEVPGVAA